MLALPPRWRDEKKRRAVGAKQLVTQEHPEDYCPEDIRGYIPRVSAALCQVRPQPDIGEEHGITFLHFTDRTEGDTCIRKSIKNVTSRRRVPVRSVLLKLGFMEYVQTVKVSGAKLLFPQWKPIRKKASAGAEKWFVQVLAATGLRDDTVRTF